MYIHVKGYTDFTQTFWSEIGDLFGGAVIHIRKVFYDAEARTVTIPVTRFRQKSKVLGLVRTCDRSVSFPTTIVVRNVFKMDVENLLEPDVSEVENGPWMVLKEKEVSLASIAEDRGMAMYIISIQIDSLDLTVADLSDLQQAREPR